MRKVFKVLLISPIYLGENVWKQEYDPEFNHKSVQVSRQLFYEYKKLAEEKGINIIAASDYAYPSENDQEHMDEKGHMSLADAVYKELVTWNIS